MFEFVKEIPVTFDPHWADKWLVWLTAASVLTSGALGFLAYWNGHRAQKISQASADRENARWNHEQEREVADARARVAHAISIALSAEDFKLMVPTEEPERKAAATLVANKALLEALAVINLANSFDRESNLRLWMNRTIRIMRDRFQRNDASYHGFRLDSLSLIADWNAGKIEAKDLP